MKNELVIKENSLVNARYKLNPIELKLVLYAIANIDRNDMDFWKFSLKISDLGIQSHMLKRAARSLMTKVFEIKEPGGWLMISWFSSIRYKEKSGIIEMQFDPNLKPYLLQLKKNFTAYNLKSVLPMRSHYSIRLYELLKQYSKIGHRTFNIDDLRNILKIPGSYMWKDIKRQILDKAESEINQYSDIEISYEPIKTGRAFTAVSFKISSKLTEETFEKFKARVRAECVNKTLMTAKDEKTGKQIELSVDEKGHLYNKLDPYWKITQKRARSIWKRLYENGVCSKALID